MSYPTHWRLPDGQVLHTGDDYYVASCDVCGWVGSSEECGTDTWGDDSDVYCPKCFKGGADCGKVAEQAKPVMCVYDGWRGVTQPCDECGKLVAVNAVSPSENHCSQECAMMALGLDDQA